MRPSGDPDTTLFASALHNEDMDGERDTDLLFHFKTHELALTEDSTEAFLDGLANDGLLIKGMDTVNIVPKGK
jgi:hypothetical protein